MYEICYIYLAIKKNYFIIYSQYIKKKYIYTKYIQYNFEGE